MYFNDFPKIEYDCTGNGNFNIIQDITTRVKVRKWIRSKGAIFSKYDGVILFSLIFVIF